MTQDDAAEESPVTLRLLAHVDEDGGQDEQTAKKELMNPPEIAPEPAVTLRLLAHVDEDLKQESRTPKKEIVADTAPQCGRSLSDNPHFAHSAHVEIRAFSHDRTRRLSNESKTSLGARLAEPEDDASLGGRSSRRCSTAPDAVTNLQVGNTLSLSSGFGEGSVVATASDGEKVSQVKTEDYHVEVTKVSEVPELDVARQPTDVLLARMPSNPLPRLMLRSRSYASLRSNLQAMVKELNDLKGNTSETGAYTRRKSIARCFTEDEENMPLAPSCEDPGGTFAALVKSVMNLDCERVGELINTGVSVNMALREEQNGVVHFSTLLHAVCDMPTDSAGQVDCSCKSIIQALVEAKANINPRNSRGATPLMYACRHKSIDVVKLLISRGAQVLPFDECGHGCLSWAAFLREDAPPLESEEPRVALPDDEERSAYLVELLLVAAVQEQEQRATRRLATSSQGPSSFMKRRGSFFEEQKKEKSEPEDELAVYAEIFKKTSGAFPPLRCAVMQQNVSAALVMMSCGAPPDWLHDAVRVGSMDLVQALLYFKADPASQDEGGASSIDTAVQLGADYRIVDLLRQNVHKTRAERIERRRSSQCSVVSIRSVQQSTPLRTPQHSQPDLRKSFHINSSEAERVMRPRSPLYDWASAKSRKAFESHPFQCFMFIMLSFALYLPDVYAVTDMPYESLDIILAFVFLAFTVDCLLQVVGFFKVYLMSFFFVMDIIGTLSLIVEFTAIKSELQGNSLTQNSVVMRATRASKIGARAGRLTRLVKLMRFLPFLRNRVGNEPGSTAKVISSRLVSRVSSIVACLIIFSVQVLPIPGSLSMPPQDFSIQMWTEHLRRALEGADSQWESIDELVLRFKAFYDRTSYKPYIFMNGTQVIWETRGPAQKDRSVRIQDGAAVVLFDFTSQVHLEAAMNMIIITLTIFLMIIFSLLISRAVSKHALTPLEFLLLKVRKIGRLIWLQVESLQVHLSDSSNKNQFNDINSADETVLLREVLGKIGVLSAIKLMRPDEDAQAMAFLGTASTAERPQTLKREVLTLRLQTVIQEDLESLEVENLTTWRFNPLEFEDPSTVTFVSAKLLSSCLPLKCKANGVTERVISAFIATVQEGYSQTLPYHNWNHAVDVMHSVYVLLQECRSVFSALEVYTLLVCACAHDIGHPGVNNEFIVQTQHELALRYNDNAPLENMHCARLFEILEDSATDVVGCMDLRKDFRKMGIEAILHTDNGCHFNVVKALQMIHEVHDEEFRNVLNRYIPNSDDKPTWPTRQISEILSEKETHDTLRNCLLHFADISNSMKPFSVARLWADNILEEFFLQGDKMSELGLPVPALLDRSKTIRPVSQLGFIEFIVSPMVFTIVKILPPLGYSEQAMMGTVKYWFEEWLSTTSPSKSEFQSMGKRVKGLYENATFAKQGISYFKRWNSI